MGSRKPDNSTYFSGFQGPGIANVASYQVAGHPYLTGSQNLATNKMTEINFPRVTNRIVLRNTTTNAPLLVTFAPTGSLLGHENVVSGSHFITLQPQADATAHLAQLDMQVKCRRIFISNKSANVGKFELFAELTGIDANEMYELTGSGITNSGVGGI
tara:strand:+ start:8653 stop:9126 length:474 start_codon:yes stop_codon:yes gene_type:complete